MVSRLLSTLAVALFASSSIAAPTEKRQGSLKFDYNNQKVRGVNLGGWFVLEPWITPSMFNDWADGNSVKDEYTLTRTLGYDEAYRRLSAHWNSWITQDDFSQIAKAGLNHVRIPIGYWAVQKQDGDPYVQGAYQKLGEALDWAQAAGLKVMIDLHGAPESQNGFDNSGRLGAIGWTQGNTIATTISVLNKIRDDHANHPAVSAIELLNEPLGPNLNMDTVRQFYMDGWGNLRDNNVAITFHDAFQGVTSWGNWGSGMWNLLLDTHHYEIFDQSQVSMDPNAHIATACDFGRQMASTGKWTIAGEFTGGITDCAKWLNGLGKGARYDGTLAGSSHVGSCDGKYTGTVAGLSNDDKYNIGRFIEAQLDAYEKATGWIFWTWKTESAPEWDMQDLLANGLFPQPLTARKYPGQCG
ncbi:glucan 1,3-beta-glucosidase precursor [Pseudovirgaria hyperparasitica]|uniref:glucan 1,3-beta-glucosidase n=1 Tax=Pseudovirgaria hyperparasitica TaxID=470096 RepID=A0A6A6W0K2_9PEZI|nr:glucan 1,3-beta-glucosidase precursor [Pseudovirgaria hyperparasitica]KAF2755460.1 glucan 1,3-beta-glucosidase precursor [Pseudovirgaria hyperparasitica]